MIPSLLLGPSQTGQRQQQPGDVLLLLLGSQSRHGVRQIPAVPLQAAAFSGPGFLHAQLVLGTLKLQLQIQHLSTEPQASRELPTCQHVQSIPGIPEGV